MVSVSSFGEQGDETSVQPGISADGRFVVFRSASTNLVTPTDYGESDIFVRDRQLGTTERVSVSSAGDQSDGYSGNPAITPDGRYVAFESQATNLVAGDGNGVDDVFLRDRQLGETIRVSVDSGGNEDDGASRYPSISANGRRIAFQTNDALDPGDGNGATDVYVRDLDEETTRCVSVNSDGVEGAGISGRAFISADGRFVAFESNADNLVAGDSNGQSDVFVHDLDTGTTTRVSVSSDGSQATGGGSIVPVLSADGSWVAFGSTATNLVSDDFNAASDIFLRRWR